jgi:hypothetical protein
MKASDFMERIQQRYVSVGLLPARDHPSVSEDQLCEIPAFATKGSGPARESRSVFEAIQPRVRVVN